MPLRHIGRNGGANPSFHFFVIRRYCKGTIYRALRILGVTGGLTPHFTFSLSDGIVRARYIVPLRHIRRNGGANPSFHFFVIRRYCKGTIYLAPTAYSAQRGGLTSIRQQYPLRSWDLVTPKYRLNPNKHNIK